MERISKKIAFKLLKYNSGWTNQEEVLLYSIQVLLEKSVVFTSLVLISIISDTILETLSIYLFMSFFRNFIGGKHAKTFWKCFLISVGIMLLALVLFFSISLTLFSEISLSLLLFLIAVLLFRNSEKALKKIGMVVVFLLLALILKNTFLSKSILVSLYITVLTK
ncbi:accessory gene regulator B family protein [Enterococcus sp.]|uniref:accessory gene regulator B family protein n=1 Tax=Enterococcus sp. TaxID=35783 RepID=UPI00290BF245|nr:accessory gene regulator B family protein [Enterococcus sp.]MDU5337104.1 accessory gene regulator B family protein [Enterococcus sp.]